MIPLEELQQLAGRELPAGRYRVEPHEAWLAADALLGRGLVPLGQTHPLHAFVAGVVGMGCDLDTLFEMAGSSAAEGPMLGESEIRYERPLRVGETLAVSGVIRGVERKHGASGTFDLLTFELTLAGEDDRTAAVLTNTFVFPRRPADAR